MIREAIKEDIKEINNLGKYLNNNFSNTYNISEYLNDDKYIILVNKDNEVNAFLIILKNIDTYEIEALAVSLDSRKKGIGYKLLNYFFDNYLNNNDKILLEVASNNEPAIKLYEKCNFKVINIRKKYYKNIDALIMEKVK